MLALVLLLLVGGSHPRNGDPKTTAKSATSETTTTQPNLVTTTAGAVPGETRPRRDGPAGSLTRLWRALAPFSHPLP
jgi:hypothetical protein